MIFHPMEKGACCEEEQFANAAQVERSHMGKIERGEHMPNLVLILRIAEALQVRPGQLVDEVVT